MLDPSVRVVRFLIAISLAGIVLAAFVSGLTWNRVVAIMASR